MSNKKYYYIGIFVIACILLNYSLKYAIEGYEMPLWLDNVGTAMAAFQLGPFCGAVVGATLNITYGFSDSVAFLYALVSMSTGIIIGIFAEKKMIDSLFHVISIGLLLSLVSAVISAPINCIFYDGYTSNIWGDGIFNLLKEAKINWFVAAFVGEFFIDFLDKVITIIILYIFVSIERRINKSQARKKSVKEDTPKKNKAKVNKAVSLFVVCVISLMAIQSTTYASDDEEEDYNSYIQFVYDSDNGLLSGEANDIVATKDGILWVGTYSGLYRYNGVQFKYMNEFSNVKNVNCLYCDEEGRLMIGTNDCGLSIAINGEIANTLVQEDGLSSNSVRCIVQQSSGRLFVGTSDALTVITLSGGVSVDRIIPDIMYAHSISADEKNHITTVTNDGDLFLINDLDIVDKNLKSEEIMYTCCSFREDGKLLVGTNDGRIILYDVSDDRFKEEKVYRCNSIGGINSINELENGTLIVCGDNGAAYFNKKYNSTLLNLGEYNSQIDHATVDYQGNVWFSSSRQGVLKLCKSPFSELYTEVGMDAEVANSVAIWNGCVYVATDAGLDIIDKRGMREIHNELTELLDGVRVRCVITDSKNNLWICTYGLGVIKLESASSMKVFDQDTGVPGSRFRFIYELSDGSIAISGDEGVVILKDDKVVDVIDTKKGLNNNIILSMYENSKGELLIGTDGGGINVVKDGKVTAYINKNDGIGSDVILRLVENKSANGVFVVTSNCISYIDYEKNDEMRVLENFPYTNNYDIYDAGNGKLFVTGSAGIYVVDKEDLLSGKSLEYELLNSLNGLRGSITANAWNCVDSDNIWYIANGNGISRLDLNQYQEKVRSYRMLLTAYEIDDVHYKIDPDGIITIPRGSTIFEVSPEIVNYSTKDPVISYYMEGIDETPVTVRQSELTSIIYTNIPAGEYDFHLAVLDDDMSKNIEEHVYRVVKENEIYDNWWFKLFFIVELVLIIASLTWFITRTFVQKTINLQKREIEMAQEQIKMGNETILAIAKTVDAKDSNTSQHSTRVSEYSVLISQKLNYTEEQQENLRKMALLHDIGKIGIPDSVLNKNGRLTDEEYEKMKSHVIVGGEILKDFTLVENVQDAAMYHHERWDGTGYGKGLKGLEIPETARIVGIADAFDAMTANRVYRKKLDFSIVLEELKKGRGTQFDPQMVDIMLELIEEGKIDVKAIYGEV